MIQSRFSPSADCSTCFCSHCQDSVAVKSISSISSFTFTWCFVSWSLDKRHTVSTCVQIQIISPQNYGYLDNIFTVLIPFVQPFPTKSWMVLILHHTNCATAYGTITFSITSISLSSSIFSASND